jgi:hypothetical protein
MCIPHVRCFTPYIYMGYICMHGYIHLYMHSHESRLHGLRDALERGLPAAPSVAGVDYHLAGAHDLRQHAPQRRRHPFGAADATRHQLLQPVPADPDRHLDAPLPLLPQLCPRRRLGAVPGRRCVARAVAHRRSEGRRRRRSVSSRARSFSEETRGCYSCVPSCETRCVDGRIHRLTERARTWAGGLRIYTVVSSSWRQRRAQGPEGVKGSRAIPCAAHAS